MPDVTLDLNAILNNSEDLVCQLPFGVPNNPESIVFTLKYLSKEDFRKLSNACQKITFVEHQNVKVTDAEKFLKALIEKCLVKWEKFSYRKLLSLAKVNKQALVQSLKAQRQDLDSEIAFSHASAFTIFKIGYSLEKWFMDSVTDITLFQSDLADLESQLGKSETSPAGN